MKPSELSPLRVLACVAWGGNRSADSDVISDGRIVFDARAAETGCAEVLRGISSARGITAPGFAARSFSACIAGRKWAVSSFGVDEEEGRVDWRDGAVNASRFALAQLTAPADEFAEFDLADEGGRYGLLGLRNGCVLWALMGIDRRFLRGGAS